MQRTTKVLSVDVSDILKAFDIDTAKYRVASVTLGSAGFRNPNTIDNGVVDLTLVEVEQKRGER